MKKLLVFIFLLIIVVICSLGSEIKLFNFSNFDIELFATEISDNIQADVIKNGDGYIVKTNSEEIDKVLNLVDGVYGVTLIIDDNSTKYEEIKSKIKVQNCQEEQNIYTFYGYINGQDKFIYVDNKKVNIQVLYNKNNSKLIIGFPIILGSY